MALLPHGNLWVWHEPVDLRKSYNSLRFCVEEYLGKDAQSGDGFIFVNRDKTLAKVLFWDRTGWCLLLKKLSSGRFRVSGKKTVKILEINHIRLFFDGL